MEKNNIVQSIIDSYINDFNFIVFSSKKKITTYINEKTNEEKKELYMPKGWTELTESNYDINDKSFFILTGKKSDLTVLDFDDVNEYNKLISKFPKLKEQYTIKTNKGYHIYFIYTDKLKSGTDLFTNYNKIDVISDGKCITAPPTSYKKINGEKVKYEIIYDNEIKTIPQYLLDELILKESDKPIIINNKISNDVKLKEDKTLYDFIEKLLDILDKERADDWEKWRNIGFIIYHELNEEGFDLFDNFSKLSDKYNKKKVKDFWKSIKDNNDKPMTIKSLMLAAKKDNKDDDNIEYYKNIIDEFIYKEVVEKTKEDYEKDIEENIKSSNDNYVKLKTEFEKKNFKVLNPIMFCTEGEYNDNLQLNTREKFIQIYENLLYKKYNAKKDLWFDYSFVKDWLIDPNNRTYYKLEFLPQLQAPENIYNTFTGYEASKKELFDIDINKTKLMEHIRNIFNNDEKCIEFHLNQMASIIQQPTILTEVSQLLKSKQGVGKDTLYDFYGNKILGSKYYLNVDNPDIIFGKFNSEMENKILVILNEASGGETYKIENHIKNAITRKTIDIEHKMLKRYKINNYANYVGLSQHTTQFKIEITDRRFTAQECNNKICNNVQYFKELYEELNSGKIDRAFYEFLMNRNIKDYHFQSNRPITKLYNTMKECTIPLLTKYLIELIDEEENINKKILSYKSSDLFRMFTSYIEYGKYEYKYTLTKFGIEIKNDYEGITLEKKRDGNYYNINVGQLKNNLIANKLYNDNFTD